MKKMIEIISKYGIKTIVLVGIGASIVTGWSIFAGISMLFVVVDIINTKMQK